MNSQAIARSDRPRMLHRSVPAWRRQRVPATEANSSLQWQKAVSSGRRGSGFAGPGGAEEDAVRGSGWTITSACPSSLNTFFQSATSPSSASLALPLSATTKSWMRFCSASSSCA